MGSGYEHKSTSAASYAERAMSPGGSRSFWAVPAGSVRVLVTRVLVTACSSGADVTRRASNVARATHRAARRAPDRRPTSEPERRFDAAAPRPFEPSTIEWEEFDDGVDVATLDVPVDYADPDGPTFELFLARHRAAKPDERIGSLLVNPGRTRIRWQ